MSPIESLPLQSSGMTQLLICILSQGIQTLGYLLSSKCGRGATSWLRIASATRLPHWGSGHRPDRAPACSLDKILCTAVPKQKETSHFCTLDWQPVLKRQLAGDPKIRTLNSLNVKTDQMIILVCTSVSHCSHAT